MIFIWSVNTRHTLPSFNNASEKVECKKMIGIYKITNKINGLVYIGQSVNIKRRWNNHKSVYNNPNDHCYENYLYRAMRKYGIENFKFEVIEECDAQELNNREKYWIQYYDSYHNGYNETCGGDNAPRTLKITIDMLCCIDDMLKNTDLKIQDISDQMHVSYEMIQGINTGRYWTRDIDYPIRERHKKKKNYCAMCGDEIDIKATLCWDCYVLSTRKCERPDKIELLKMVSEMPMTHIGKKYHVTDNTIRKWCDSYGIPKKKSDAIEYIVNNNITFEE